MSASASHVNVYLRVDVTQLNAGLLRATAAIARLREAMQRPTGRALIVSRRARRRDLRRRYRKAAA